MEDMIYTVAEVAKLLKSNVEYIHKLRKAGLLRFLKLGSYKCRKSTLETFTEKYEGWDLSDPFNIVPLEGEERREETHENIKKIV